MGAAGGCMSMQDKTAAYLTEGEALVLERALPVGMKPSMRELTYVLYEALVLQDPRAARPEAWRKQPAGEWLQMLTAMARAACVQAEHLSDEIGGQMWYIAKSNAASGERNQRIYAEFNGRNHQQLAKKYNLTQMRIYQIVAAMQEDEFARRQGKLPGLD
jgi:Mor transcription activator family